MISQHFAFEQLLFQSIVLTVTIYAVCFVSPTYKMVNFFLLQIIVCRSLCFKILIKYLFQCIIIQYIMKNCLLHILFQFSGNHSTASVLFIYLTVCRNLTLQQYSDDDTSFSLAILRKLYSL